MFLVQKGLITVRKNSFSLLKNITLKKLRILGVIKGLLNFVNSLVVVLPSRKSLTLSWNFGRILGIILAFQILTGTFLL